MGSFLSGLMEEVGPKIRERYAKDLDLKNQEKQAEFDSLWGSVRNSQSEIQQLQSKQNRTPEEDKRLQQLQSQADWSWNQLQKTGKGPKSPLESVIQKVRGVDKAVTDARQQGQRQPSPNGQLKAPAAAQPQDQSAQSSQAAPLQPPQAAAQQAAATGTLKPPAGASPNESQPAAQGGANLAPQSQASGPLQPPVAAAQAQPAGQRSAAPQQQPQQQATPAPSMQGAMALAAQDPNAGRKVREAEELDVFKTNEQIRAKNEEERNALKLKDEESKKQDDAAKAFADTIKDPTEQSAFLKSYANKKFLGTAELKTEAPTPEADVHVKVAGEWKPALQSKDGKIKSLDGKAIDASKIEDINKSGPAPEKFTGELKERVDANRVLSTSKDPNEISAARETLKSLEQKRQAAITKIVMDQGGNKSISDEDLKVLAKNDVITHQHSELSVRSPELKAKYEHFRAEAMREMGGAEGAAASSAEYRASAGNLANLQKIKGQMEASKNGTDAEIDRLMSLAKKVPRSQSKLFNKADQFLKANLTDYPELAAYREALVAARYRYNSMIASFKGGGAATNQVRTETAEEIMDRTMASGSLEAAAKEMKVGLNNVMGGLDKALTDTQKAMRSKVSPSGEQKPPDASSPQNVKTWNDKTQKFE